MTFLTDIARQVELVDLLDIALVSAVFYVIMRWLRGSIPESASRRILVAAPAVAAIYVLVRVFDLFLLERVIQVLLVALLVVAVVVFQSDIRRMLDRAVSRNSWHRQAAYESTTVDLLTEVTSKMADLRMGALIAIKGREPLDSHIHGGIELDGRVTQPLLLGIFHPETPGHDGAVLIDGDLVHKFAVHLPLASNMPAVSRFGGTRHAAALGLAEESDALVVVVSEERGEISVAQDGRLTEEVSVSGLKERLETFWKEHYAHEPPARRSWWRRPNIRTAAAAIVTAVSLWVFIVYSPNTVMRTLQVPVEFRNLPQGWSVEGQVPSNAEVSLSGPEQVFRRLDTDELAVSIDMSQPHVGPDEIVIAESDLNLPAGIDLNRVDPQVIRVSLSRLQSLTVPVAVRTSGTLPDSLQLAGVKADPDSISIMVPIGEDLERSMVETKAIDLASIRRDSTITTRLVLPEGSSLPSGASKDVTVEIRVRPAVTSDAVVRNGS